jgi:hypothetical protein
VNNKDKAQTKARGYFILRRISAGTRCEDSPFVFPIVIKSLPQAGIMVLRTVPAVTFP